MGTLENEAIKYAEEDYLKGVASVERTPNYEIINAFPGFIKTKLKYAFIAGAYFRDALLAEGRKFDQQKETKTCDNCKYSDLPGGYEPCVYCRNKDDWKPKESPCPCEDGIDSKACVGCEHSEDGKREYKPYVTVEEFIQDYQERFPTAVPRPAHTMPLIWVKTKSADAKFLVTGFMPDSDDGDYVEVHGYNCNMDDLLEYYVYLDGSPCGKEC